MRSLYLLAAPSTPEPARQEIIDRTASGEKLSYEDIRGTIDATAGTKARSPKLAPAKLPSYDDIVDQMIVLLKQLTPRDQNRCLLKLRAFLRGL